MTCTMFVCFTMGKNLACFYVDGNWQMQRERGGRGETGQIAVKRLCVKTTKKQVTNASKKLLLVPSSRDGPLHHEGRSGCVLTKARLPGVAVWRASSGHSSVSPAENMGTRFLPHRHPDQIRWLKPLPLKMIIGVGALGGDQVPRSKGAADPTPLPNPSSPSCSGLVSMSCLLKPSTQAVYPNLPLLMKTPVKSNSLPSLCVPRRLDMEEGTSLSSRTDVSLDSRRFSSLGSPWHPISHVCSWFLVCAPRWVAHSSFPSNVQYSLPPLS